MEHQVSVWDFPRPPRIENVSARLKIVAQSGIVAETLSAYRVLETAGAPTYYFPPRDVAVDALARTGSKFHCEWKGVSEEFSTAGIVRAGWTLTAAYPEFLDLLGFYSFYPGTLQCFIDEVEVLPQPGGYYGGWLTPDLVGPIKGAPGTESW